jgi:hypothetical protein
MRRRLTMKLTRIRKYGRYINPLTGRDVNVHVGTQVNRSNSVLFYLYRGKRILITDRDFYHNWKAVK